MAVFEKVQEIIVEELGKDAEEVKVETTFDELDADSLDVFQVISEIEDEFDRFYPEVLLSEITIPNAEDLRENPTLYPEVDSQYEAQWTSSNPAFLKVENNEGVITVPTPEQGDQQITLTLSTKIKNRQFQRDFPITIRAQTPATRLLRDVKALPITLGTLLNAGSKSEAKRS